MILKQKVSRFYGLCDVGTKWVHVCEGAVRYPVGWVQDCDIVLCYGLFK